MSITVIYYYYIIIAVCERHVIVVRGQLRLVSAMWHYRQSGMYLNRFVDKLMVYLKVGITVISLPNKLITTIKKENRKRWVALSGEDGGNENAIVTAILYRSTLVVYNMCLPRVVGYKIGHRKKGS